MFLLRLFRYLRGYVQFTASGVFIERFLNLLARDRIPVWNSRKRGDSYTGCVSAAHYARLRAHAKKACVRIRLQEKTGAPFQRRKYRRRKGLLVGLAVFALFLFIMSSFIWRIQVNGLENVAEHRVLAVLEDLGITSGTLRRSIDVRDAERRALIALPELSWIALNIDGSTIYVETYETVPPPANMVAADVPCNVVAAFSGQILSIQVYDGQALIMKGDTVMAGDVVVSGITQDRRGQNLFRHARAEVMAEVQHAIELTVPLDQIEYVETGEVRSRSFLQVFGFQMPLFIPTTLPGPYHVDREDHPLSLFGVELPLNRHDERYTMMEELLVRLTEEQAQQEALQQLAVVEQAQLGDAEILERRLTARLEGDELVLRAEYIAHLDIAVEQEIFLESSESE